MPDNQKNNRFMSMLERSGIVRRSEDDSASPDDTAGIINPDIKTLFDPPEDGAAAKSAPGQSARGLSTPIFPPDSVAEQPQASAPVETAATPLVSSTLPTQSGPPAPAPVTASAAYSEPPKPASSFGGLNLFKTNGNGSPDTAAMESVLNESEREPQPENYTDRYLDVNELYDALALRSKKTDSIYLIEDYLSTLPSSLPDSQRRKIVSDLLSASGFDFDLLMGDGVLRVKMLKEYAERFARHTDDYIAARQAEIEELDQQMMRTRKLIENRKELHKRQFYTIEAEAQRLKEILTFISG